MGPLTDNSPPRLVFIPAVSCSKSPARQAHALLVPALCDRSCVFGGGRPASSEWSAGPECTSRSGTQWTACSTVRWFQRQTQPSQTQFGSQPGNKVQNGQRGQSGRGQQQTGGVQIRRSNREEQNATREFTVNALRFDFNGDRQLAANELQNMFVFLATQQNQAIGPYVNGGYRRQLRQRLLGNTGYGRVGDFQTTTTTTTIGPAVQGVAIQRAVQVFLQLILQFDLNNDGMLSQAELMRFAQT